MTEPVELRIRIHRHLRAHPGLTVHELGRVLNVSPSSLRRCLRAMEYDGEAAPEIGPKCEGDPRPVTRWKAT